MNWPLFHEIGLIVGACAQYAMKAEMSGEAAAEKKKKVVDTVMKEVQDPGGIEIKNKIVLQLLPTLVPIAVDLAVWGINKTGFFGKSTG